jgi:hypothetical protein
MQRRADAMLRMEAKSKLPPDKVGEKLKRFFGEGGLGLELSEEASGCLTFQGGGGYVTATLCLEEDKTRVDLVTQEWDYQVKKFASELT